MATYLRNTRQSLSLSLPFTLARWWLPAVSYGQAVPTVPAIDIHITSIVAHLRDALFNP